LNKEGVHPGRFLLFFIRSIIYGIITKLQKISFGLKTKITTLLILNVAGVLLLYSYVDYQLTKKAQLDLYLDRNLYIATQIGIDIPDKKILEKTPIIQKELDDWVFSRPSLVEIDVFLISSKGYMELAKSSKGYPNIPFSISKEEIKLLKKDKHISSIREVDDEKFMDIIVPFRSKGKVIGAVRILSSLEEAQSYLTKKKRRAFLFTFLSVVIIFMAEMLLFGKIVGKPIKKLIDAMDKAEKGDLQAEANIKRRDELGELSRHFNRMIKTIRETHEQNIQLLSEVSHFNEELTRKIEDATSELSKRNEELRLLNEALFESQRELSQSEKLAALGQVAATIAHQIGTPLNSISGYIQLMLNEENLEPKTRERLMIIESQLDRLTESVKNLLSITRIPKPKFKPLDLNLVIHELIQLIEPWLVAKKVELVSNLASELPLIYGDATNLQTVFLNIITNAIDAMPNGGLLKITTQHVLNQSMLPDGGWIEVSISDTGIGITEESKKRIFDPFFTTKKIGEGSGLGLSICHKIVKEHSGRMEVQSEVGKGSTFSVFIPISKNYEEEEQRIGHALGRG
jgi:signal transduction histidine kinase